MSNGRTKGDVSYRKFLLCYDYLKASLEEGADPFTETRAIFENGTETQFSELLKEADDWKKEQEKVDSPPAPRGRQVSPKTLEALRGMVSKEVFAKFEAGKLDDKARTKLLNAARATVKALEVK